MRRGDDSSSVKVRKYPEHLRGENRVHLKNSRKKVSTLPSKDPAGPASKPQEADPGLKPGPLKQTETSFLVLSLGEHPVVPQELQILQTLIHHHIIKRIAWFQRNG